MSRPTLWKITCMEDNWPGLWHLWLKHQCVTVGYGPFWGYRLEGGKTKGELDWVKARKALAEIKVGDFIVAALPGRRIGRLGEVIRKEIDKDFWQPLLPISSDDPDGEMGRRILVRWDLVKSPEDFNLVAKLPEDIKLGRGTLNRIRSRGVEWFRKVMSDPANWVGLVGRFGYESALSDYIALYPHRLEDGLRPYPSEKVRERIFKNMSRLDVLLQDKRGRPVIVESKQDSPTVEDIRQLRRYMRLWKKEPHHAARGILVHGGARKLDALVSQEAKKHPRVEIMQYKLDVDFAPSR